jgi:hypothetical protein
MGLADDATVGPGGLSEGARAERQELLRYDGDNFDHTGAPMGFFKGNLLEVDDSGTVLTIVRFRGYRCPDNGLGLVHVL